MIKRFKKIIAIVMFIVSISSIPVYAVEDSKQKVILIDAGHGGIDGGAKSKNGTIEKGINLSISNKLKVKLEEKGYKVYMTRDEDKEISTKKVQDLEARCKMKKETKCDVFISIHQNKFTQESCYGAQVWYASNEKSQMIATTIQESLKEKVDDNNKRVAKPAKNLYKILRDGYDGACVIVECGFLSNYKEEQKLKTDEHQDKIVDGILGGVEKYFQDKKE
ncbi:MAG: N-acetylmuramoyl-L-alanine amidase [Clostridium sp.]